MSAKQACDSLIDALTHLTNELVELRRISTNAETPVKWIKNLGSYPTVACKKVECIYEDGELSSQQPPSNFIWSLSTKLRRSSIPYKIIHFYRIIE